MLTYTKTVVETKPRLEIFHDQFATSPREDSNLGYFITIERNYDSPDKAPEIYRIVKEAAEEAANVDEHMEVIRQAIQMSTGEKVIYITPVYRYEHGNVVYKRGTAKGFDYSNSGFYIVTDKTAAELGSDPKDFEGIIDAELEMYTKWANGEVYSVNVYDEDGELQDVGLSCYSLEDVAAGLPEEFANEDLYQYIIQ